MWSSQDLVDSPSARFLSSLELLWAYAAQMAVAARTIVEPIDIVSDILPRQIARLVDLLLNPLLLQAADERLRDGIVPAVAFPTRARLKTIAATEPPPGIAAVLRA